MPLHTGEQATQYFTEHPHTIEKSSILSPLTRYGHTKRSGGGPSFVGDPLFKRKVGTVGRAKIWAREHILGEPSLISATRPKYKAGFIGRPSGPLGYRQSVATETAKVGVGICKGGIAYSKGRYNEIMANCQIIVCPRGWGEQSRRHWDAWLSGKPVLTDRDCDSVEMIPGLRLQQGVHYLVFDDPKEIPDIVSDWTRPSRLDDLAQIAENGRRAALAYDACSRIIEFFEHAVKSKKHQQIAMSGSKNS